ncbi:hypothetical protein N0B31_16965 [Salinirubellus salinus]|jgi:hypothetical protein|uniref:Uncharacterized protein n=1 Tax=Salinirubellus salinus TaxID=1364945 RepID=A0A9E7R2X0_9EURY|nr:hypothetical protein [Salinirubellus salinus]UWM53813.1 hypothetical protein N0B31_16965 [Salinirubellus salinus]
MELRLTRTERRVLAVGALLNGLAHLAFPGLLTDLVRMVYDAALDVSFVPRDETDRRVRALGVLSCLLVPLLFLVPLEE